MNPAPIPERHIVPDRLMLSELMHQPFPDSCRQVCPRPSEPPPHLLSSSLSYGLRGCFEALNLMRRGLTAKHGGFYLIHEGFCVKCPISDVTHQSWSAWRKRFWAIYEGFSISCTTANIAHGGKTSAREGLSLVDEVKTSVLRGQTFVLHGSTLIDGVKTFISDVFTKRDCLPAFAPNGQTVADKVPTLANGSPSVVDG